MSKETQNVEFSFHHVGCAVKSIDDALSYYTGVMGFKQVSEKVKVSSQKVNVCFVEMADGVLLELVEGTGEDSPIKRRIEESGGGPYHLCYAVDDLDTTVKDLRKQGFHRLKRFEVPLAGINRFAFMLTPDRQLLELCEKSPDAL